MTCKIDTTANGSTVAFPFPFPIPSAAALEVRVNGSVWTEGFRVNCAGSADGGVVLFNTAPAAGDTISLRYLGAVTVGVEDAAAGHLGEKLIAGANILLETVTEVSGVQRLRVSASTPVDALEKAANLSDLTDKATARTNLDVYSKAEVDAADQALRNGLFATNVEAAAMSVADKAITPANLGALFGRSVADSGYQKLPGGLMLQWGEYLENGTPLPAGGNVVRNISFPTAFSACFKVIACTRHNYVLVAPVNAGPNGFSASFSNDHNGALNLSMSYIAIGRA